MYRHLPKFVFFFLFSILLGTVTWVETQPSGHLSRFPRFTTAGRPTCNASRAGHPIWNTTLSEAQVCNGTTYVSFSGAVAFPGLAADYTWTGIHVFSGTTNPNGVAESISLGLSGGSGSVIVLEGNVADALEGRIVYTDTAGNGSISLSPDNDNPGSPALSFSMPPAAGAGGSLQAITATLAAMNGSDTVNSVNISTTNANHTGTGNTLNLLSLAAIAGDANSNLNAISIGALTGTTGAASEREDAITIGTGWDSHISSGDNIRLSVGAVSNTVTFGSTTGAAVLTINMNQETTVTNGSAIAVVGAAQNINPDSWIQRVSAGAAADVTTISAPPGTNTVARLTFICTDANLTFTDGAGGGGANTLEMAGSFTCSADDTITFARYIPAAGNNRWVEVSRSVN